MFVIYRLFSHAPRSIRDEEDDDDGDDDAAAAVGDLVHCMYQHQYLPRAHTLKSQTHTVSEGEDGGDGGGNKLSELVASLHEAYTQVMDWLCVCAFGRV